MNRITLFENMEINHSYETDTLLLEMSERMTRTEKPYVQMRLCDGHRVVTARCFNCTREDLNWRGIEVGNVVRMTINVNLYNNDISYIIGDIWAQDTPKGYVDKFVVKTDIDIEHSFKDLLNLIDDASNEVDAFFDPISMLAKEILLKYRCEFCHSVAGKKIHHNTIGGLLKHTLSVTIAANKMADEYQNLDRELLVCGAALHDIGKLQEIRTSDAGIAEYTDVGKLVGHSILGAELIAEENKKSNGFFDPERVLLLRHLLLSHHGSVSYGAAVEPSIPEAAVLHACDSMDAKIDTMQMALRELRPGSFSAKVLGLNNYVYKPSIDYSIVAA